MNLRELSTVLANLVGTAQHLESLSSVSHLFGDVECSIVPVSTLKETSKKLLQCATALREILPETKIELPEHASGGKGPGTPGSV